MEVRKSDGGEPSRVEIFTLRETVGPAVYLDGEIFDGNPSEIRPEEIERIEVLEGESALEQYGEAGADGVIRITTKAAARTDSGG